MILIITGVHCDSFDFFKLILCQPFFYIDFFNFMMLVYYLARLDVLLIPVLFFLTLKDFSSLNKAFIYHY